MYHQFLQTNKDMAISMEKFYSIRAWDWKACINFLPVVKTSKQAHSKTSI